MFSLWLAQLFQIYESSDVTDLLLLLIVFIHYYTFWSKFHLTALLHFAPLYQKISNLNQLLLSFPPDSNY